MVDSQFINSSISKILEHWLTEAYSHMSVVTTGDSLNGIERVQNFVVPHGRRSVPYTLIPSRYNHFPPPPPRPSPSFLCTLTSFSKLLPHSLLPHSCSSSHIFTLHSLVCVRVFCLSGCACSNLSKHSLVWELRDPCVWCVVWEQHEQQIHHARSGAYTHTPHIHTPQGLIAETTCSSSWI